MMNEKSWNLINLYGCHLVWYYDIYHHHIIHVLLTTLCTSNAINFDVYRTKSNATIAYVSNVRTFIKLHNRIHVYVLHMYISNALNTMIIRKAIF